MISISIKKLSRRCLCLVAILLATGCSSMKQMPSASNVLIEERSSTAVSQVVQTEVTPSPQVADNSLASEKPQDKILTEYVVKRFKVSESAAAQIVTLAGKHAHEEFPKQRDILAIIAVESSYKVKALLRGCYGLMQIERKSHLKKLAGRSLYDPAVNIELGSSILNQYYLLAKRSKRGATLAYNAGIGNYLKGRYKSEYHTKYLKELSLLPKE